MKDIYGKALLDFQNKKYTQDIKTFSTLGGEDVYPLPYLFRDFKNMPKIEQVALQQSFGKILDVGCGAGSHSLYLQQKNKNVTAIDISNGAIEVCRLRGINFAKVQNIWDIKEDKFDTILLLMNGAGMCGKLNKLAPFLTHLKTLLTPNGQLLLDSSDVIYMFEQEKDGSYVIDAMAEYYGETTFVMEYKKEKSQPFHWLYVDFNSLKQAATLCNLNCELIQHGEHFDYLAKITL